jgi:hypothetical protein
MRGKSKLPVAQRRPEAGAFAVVMEQPATKRPFPWLTLTRGRASMDWNRVEGNWKKVKEQWGKLSDDDLTAINGRRDQLEG